MTAAVAPPVRARPAAPRPTGRGEAGPPRPGSPRRRRPAVVATLLAWRLPVPVSRAVVLPGPGTDLVVTGGLTPSGASGNGAFLVSTHTGAIHLVAGLVAAVYDASGAILAGRDVIFGGAATGTGGTGTGGGTRTAGQGQAGQGPARWSRSSGPDGRGGARSRRADGHGQRDVAPTPCRLENGHDRGHLLCRRRFGRSHRRPGGAGHDRR